MSSLTSLPHKFSRRQLRGLGILARGGQIVKVNDGVYKVRSQTSSATYSVVNVGNKLTCNCPDYAKKLQPCKHIFAASFFVQLPAIIAANTIGYFGPYNINNSVSGQNEFR